jgi:hypothetical protein
MRPTVVIGDIHGRADLFRKLLENIRARFGTDVTIFHVGDLVDRGPNSKEVVQLCIDNEVDGILGNHELWLHQYLATGVFDSFGLHPSMQGIATLKSYGINSTDPGEIERQLAYAIPESHKEYILSLPVIRRIDAGGKVYRLIHSGLKRDTATAYLPAAEKHHKIKGSGSVSDSLADIIATETPASVMWTSNSWKNGPDLFHFPDDSIQILGHSPTPRGEPLITSHWIAVDCGCGVRRSVLACVVLGTHEVISTNTLATKGVSDKQGFTDFTM